MKTLFKIFTFFTLTFWITAAEAQSSNTPLSEEKTLDSTITVFGNHHYKLTLQIFNPDENDELVNNATLTLRYDSANLHKTIFKDSLYCSQLRMQRKDFNRDGVNDVLIFHASSARSNWSHYLYLTNRKYFKLTPVKGFTKLLNPEVNKKTGIITSTALYGNKMYYSFYKISGNSTILKVGKSYSKTIR